MSLILKTVLLENLKLILICSSLASKRHRSISGGRCDGLISDGSAGLIGDDGGGTNRSAHETGEWTTTIDDANKRCDKRRWSKGWR